MFYALAILMIFASNSSKAKQTPTRAELLQIRSLNFSVFAAVIVFNFCMLPICKRFFYGGVILLTKTIV